MHGYTLDRPRPTVGVDIVPLFHLARNLRRAHTVLTAPEIDTIADVARHQFPARMNRP
ncbi:MAG: hypothetical protein M3308_11000 [Actinomycetota bacterium]|nr:hypothetical protein [Actinomycetota bacterium]